MIVVCHGCVIIKHVYTPLSLSVYPSRSVKQTRFSKKERSGRKWTSCHDTFVNWSIVSYGFLLPLYSLLLLRQWPQKTDVFEKCTVCVYWSLQCNGQHARPDFLFVCCINNSWGVVFKTHNLAVCTVSHELITAIYKMCIYLKKMF